VNAAELRALTLIQVRDGIGAGNFTSEEVTLAAIAQADRFDAEYALFITRASERALLEAKAADQALQAGRSLGPLHGVPITIKDNIDTAGLLTTAGAKVFAQRVPETDATVVEKLNQVGAISLGKTNMHEMALGGTSTNPHYGAVRNPWAPDRIPGGSSGGAAACQSLNIGYAALGTDSGGSVRMPAALCGLVGLKQTHGLVSLSGCVPTGTWSTDHIGPITHTVDDAQLMLELMLGFDATDPDSLSHTAPAFEPLPDLTGVKVGVPERYFWEKLDPQVERICRGRVAVMAEAGAELITLTLSTIDLLLLARQASLAELYVFHEPYLRAHPEDYGDDIRGMLLAGQYILAHDYVRAGRLRRIFMQECAAVLEQVDVLVMPTVPIPAPPIGATTVTLAGEEVPLSGRGAWTLARNTFPFNQAGVPAVSLPAGLTTDGLPVGLQLVAGALQDFKLLAIARVLESLVAVETTPPVARELELAR
jgi:aspartyl-tRNA(Asn)/glutamyl-tRNA(Gln) amidotransferase subunit A